MTTTAWPPWWSWELELTPHLERRMEDRGLTEVELREMLQRANAFRQDFVEGRYVVEATVRGRAWEVIVEPDDVDRLLVVITAYTVESR